ncbi:hypothetical protein FH972_024654 [Carpinus fangiana]|uniref:Uncharacterized protein n=1 Tax=Carpinus fangiana TaxID=176857 RepID=A0A5N6KZ52_9ROSI|nr:hypothetical protein FH972_024654 [Carpinus fangiana]
MTRHQRGVECNMSRPASSLLPETPPRQIRITWTHMSMTVVQPAKRCVSSNQSCIRDRILGCEKQMIRLIRPSVA